MTVNQVITTVAELNPNAYTEAQIAEWVFELNRTLAKKTGQTVPALSFPADGEAELLVKDSALYVLYVSSLLDFYSNDIARYNQSAALFNQAMEEYLAGYRKTQRPPARVFHGYT